jgi:hypothetical protein
MLQSATTSGVTFSPSTASAHCIYSIHSAVCIAAVDTRDCDSTVRSQLKCLLAANVNQAYIDNCVLIMQHS